MLYNEKIPLVEDVTKIYSTSDVVNFIDPRMIEIHKDMIEYKNIEYTNEDIYNYIKFINFTCIDPSCYRHVVKHINVNNISYFNNLFDNNDISEELIPFLPYNIASLYLNFGVIDNITIKGKIKEKWIEKNMEWVLRHDTSLLDPYLAYKGKYGKYFIIDDKTYGIHKKVNIREGKFDIIYDIYDASTIGVLPVVKYIVEKININEIIREYEYVLVEVLSESIGEAAMNGHLDIVIFSTKCIIDNNLMNKAWNIYMVTEYSVCNWGMFSIRHKEVFKYLVNNVDIDHHHTLGCLISEKDDVEMVEMLMPKIIQQVYVSHIRDTFKKVCKYGRINTLKYLLEYNKDYNIGVNDYGEDVMNAPAGNGHMDVIIYMFENGMDINRYGYSIIRHSTNVSKGNRMGKSELTEFNIFMHDIEDEDEDEDELCKFTLINDNKMNIVKFVLNKFEIIDYDKLLESAAMTGDSDIIDYVMDNYMKLEKIKDVHRIISAGFHGGNIEFIKKVIYKCLHINNTNVIDLMKKVSEEECINFFKYLNINNVHIDGVDEIIIYAINNRLYNIIIYFHEYFKSVTDETVKIDDIQKCMLHFADRDKTIEFIKYLHVNELIKPCHIEEILLFSANIGYLELIKYFETYIKSIDDILLEACIGGSLDIIRYSIELGADINYIHKIDKFNTILDGSEHSNKNYMLKYAVIYPSLHMDKLEKHVDIVECLISVGVNKNIAMNFIYLYRKDIRVKSYIHIIKHLYDDESDTNTIKNILMDSCERNILELVIFFKDYIGYYVNEILEISSNNSHVDIVKFLVDNDYGKYADRTYNKSIIYASKHGRLDIIKLLIIYIDINNFDGLALIESCENEQLETVVYLIENGANITSQDNKPLKISAKNCYIDIVRYLIEVGAPLEILKLYSDVVEIKEYLEEINS